MKSITIESCSQCPHYRKLSDREMEIHWCRKLNKRLEWGGSIFRMFEIPKECPLVEATFKTGKGK